MVGVMGGGIRMFRVKGMVSAGSRCRQSDARQAMPSSL